jgi:RNA polymerase sigma-70 factor (TIGR02960 family)
MDDDDGSPVRNCVYSLSEGCSSPRPRDRTSPLPTESRTSLDDHDNGRTDMTTVEPPSLDYEAGRRRRPTRAAAPERRLEQHRAELTVLCRRMLGSCEAEDAVQETLVRAWRAFDRYEGRAALRSWLYRIALNVCLDSFRARQRRARCIEAVVHDLAAGPVSNLEHATVVAAIPTGPVAAALRTPAEATIAREAVGLALAALMHLPPRQRAVLILQDVLRWRAAEVAQLLDTTVASVNSALQRARSTLAALRPSANDPCPPEDRPQRELLARYVDAFERYDLELLNSILREDASRAPTRPRSERTMSVERLGTTLSASPVRPPGAERRESGPDGHGALP